MGQRDRKAEFLHDVGGIVAGGGAGALVSFIATPVGMAVTAATIAATVFGVWLFTHFRSK